MDLSKGEIRKQGADGESVSLHVISQAENLGAVICSFLKNERGNAEDSLGTPKHVQK